MLRVFESKLLRMIFGPTREEATGFEEHDITRSFKLCMLIIKSRRTGWKGHVTSM
jgi:hypothetical protein